MRAVFLSLHFAKSASRTGGYGVQAAQAKNFVKAYKRDNQLLLKYVM